MFTGPLPLPEITDDGSENEEIDTVFEELRTKLLQLDQKNVENAKLRDEIASLLAEKREAFIETEKLKFKNQELASQLALLSKSAKHAEIQENETQAKNHQLAREIESLKSENVKLATTNMKLLTDLNDIQKRYDTYLEKTDALHKISQEVSAKKAQNQEVMLTLAKQIGHAKATSLYLHQLKEQVNSSFKIAFDFTKRLQNERNSGTSKDGEVTQMQPKRVRFSDDLVTTTTTNIPGSSSSSNWRKTENYWKTINETLRTELHKYKEELWMGLHSLNQLSSRGSNREDQSK